MLNKVMPPFMIEYLKAYMRRDPAAKSLLEVALLYPGPKAMVFHRIAHWLYSQELFFFARMVSEFSKFITGIEIHPGAKIGRHLVIDHGLGIVIGETTEIGDDCLIYQGVTLGGTALKPIKRHPTLGNDVIIGAGAMIIGAVQLGDHSRVGANSVVTKNVQPNTTVVGAPAMPVEKSS